MMMQRLILAVVCLGFTPLVAGQTPPKPLITGLKNATAVAVGGDGRIYVTVKGHEKGAGSVVVIDKDKAVPFATGLNEPQEIAAYRQWLFVADGTRILRIDPKGKAEVFAAAEAFPQALLKPFSIVADSESGTVFVSDLSGFVYRISPKGKVSTLFDGEAAKAVPVTLLIDGASHLLVSDSRGHRLLRIKLSDRSTETVLEDKDRPVHAMAWDRHGRLLLAAADDRQLRLLAIPRPGVKPLRLRTSASNVVRISMDIASNRVVVLDELGTLTAVPITIPGHEVDETPLPLQTALAFPELKWEGWKGASDDGKVNELRTMILTHAGDGSNRVFVGEQHGVIYVFPNDPKATEARIFLDLRDRVAYNDNMNEEGFLGIAFHPKFKENGELFVYYTTKKAKSTNILSRFRVRKDDPNRADPDSEEELMRFQKPFWNHDGGTVCFGPDGYLYTTHGDGGAANDPYDNGQNLKSLLGKVHRIDVDRKDPGKNYAIPKDNPFVDRADVRPEIWAFGLRNIWRMAFDRKTGRLWAADVGQNLYEEIDLIERGGNYGWNRREGLHPFGAKGTGLRKEFIEPIWEYHHDLGKSITGGAVYRGNRLPELDGYYIYADYVSGKIWALFYDEANSRVVANRPIKDRNIPIFSFGEDEKGEIYLLTATTNGQGIYHFTK